VRELVKAQEFKRRNAAKDDEELRMPLGQRLAHMAPEGRRRTGDLGARIRNGISPRTRNSEKPTIWGVFAEPLTRYLFSKLTSGKKGAGVCGSADL
jgi:hypothetical protein